MAACGLLLALSAPGYGAWWLAWVELIPALVWTASQARSTTVFWGGFCLGAVFHGIYCLWFFDLHPLTWLGFSEAASRMVTLAGWLIIALEGGLMSGLLFVLWRKLPAHWLRVPLFSVFWVLGFALFALTPLALPWAMLEYTQAPVALMRELAGYVGAGGVALLLLMHNALWTHLWLKAPHVLAGKRRIAVPAIIAALLLLLGLSSGQTGAPEATGMPVAVVQANLPIEIVRNPVKIGPRVEPVYIRPVLERDLPPGTLVVFPEEGVVPGLVPAADPARNPWMARLMALSKEKRFYVVVGASMLESENRLYNAMALISPDSETVQLYRKRRLVPFGEFTPYGLGPWLTNLLAGWRVHYTAPFLPGEDAPLLRAGSLKLGGLICFEMIDAFPGVGGYAVQAARQGADWLVNVSNLGWFHQNALLEAQFLAIAQMRAAEARRPMVIAGNTGISVILSANGARLVEADPVVFSQHKTQVLFYNGSR